MESHKSHVPVTTNQNPISIHNYGKIHHFQWVNHGKSHYDDIPNIWKNNTAMLVCQRVNPISV